MIKEKILYEDKVLAGAIYKKESENAGTTRDLVD